MIVDNSEPRVYEIFVRRNWPHPKNRYGSFHTYFNVHLVELDVPSVVKLRLLGKSLDNIQVNPRHKLIKQIVKSWRKCYFGRTPRCKYGKALSEALALKASLEGNNEFSNGIDAFRYLARLRSGVALSQCR